MANDDRDLSIRDATILALRNSQQGLAELKGLFSKASGHFDSGEDDEGLNIIAGDVIPRIKAFFGFCKSLVDINHQTITEANGVKLGELFVRSEALMKKLFAETEARNFTEVGDILRFDFSDLLSEYGVLLPALVEDFKNSKNPALDSH